MNAVIDNVHPLSIRNDIGVLWENFLFMVHRDNGLEFTS